jgi:hypothetical protein
MKFIQKLFGWTLTYKTLALLEGLFTYIKDYYYISDTLYSAEFKAVIKRYLYIELRKDWIGRLYGVINPNIDINGKYDFNNTILEIDGENTNNNDYVKHWVYKQMDLINQLFKIEKLYDYISIDFKHVGPSHLDNYLIIFDVISRKYTAQTFKSWFKTLCVYGVIATIVLFIIL